MNIAAKYKYQLWLLLLVLVAYIPYTSFQSSLLNDDIDVALSTKYFAGECLQDGFLPLWNPYQIWGFPAHADLQYTNWNLETLLVGLLFGYNYITLHILFIIYLFLAALGAFLLARHLSKDAKTAFYIGCVYVLSGLVVAHTQSLVTILGLVWLPYVTLYFFKWLQEPTIRNTIALTIFSYLLMTLGYQAFVFMLLPAFVLLFIQRLVSDYKHNDRAAIRQKLILGILAVVALLVLLAPLLVSQFQAKPFVNRLNGMAVKDVMENPLSPRSLVSLINPVLTIGHDEWFRTEVTMRNIFMGTMPLLLLIVSLFKRKKTAIDIILLSVAAFYLLGSFGDIIIPVRKLMYYVLPGFKLFRFPSLLRVVAILLLLCYWAINARGSLEFLYHQKRKRNLFLFLFLLLDLVVCSICFIKLDRYSFFDHIHHGFHNRIVHADPLEISFYVSLGQLLLAGFALIAFNWSKTFDNFKHKVILITVLEMMAVVWIYGQFTAFGAIKPKDLQANFANMQKGFPLPSQDPLMDPKYKFDHLHHFWKNTGAFKKQLVNDDAWTSFYFSNYDQLVFHITDLKDSLWSYPFAYVSKPLEAEKPVSLPVDTSTGFIGNTFHYRNTQAKWQYTAFSPQQISITIKAEEPLVFNLQQSYYTGWKVRVDGIEQPMLWNAGLLMSVAVPKGLHAVSFEHHNPVFEKALAISYTMLVLLVVAYIIVSPLPRRRKQFILLVFLALALGICALFFKRSQKDATVKNGFTFNHETSTLYYDFNSKQDILAAIASQEKHKPKSIRYSWSNFYNAPELLYALGINPEKYQAEQQSMNAQISWQPVHEARPLLQLNFDSTYQDQAFIDTNQVNKYSLLVNEQQNPYSAVIPLDVAILAGHNAYGYVTLKAEHFSNPMIVCKITHADGTEESVYFTLQKYLFNKADWETVPFYFDLKNKIKPNDRAGLFVMNATTPNVFVKGFRVEYFQ